MIDMIDTPTITSASVNADRRELKFRLAGMKIFMAFSVSILLLTGEKHADCRLKSGKTVSQNE